ncbi:N-acetyl-gamma-glutamyl-phosphate reductase [soil metagenome]
MAEQAHTVTDPAVQPLDGEPRARVLVAGATGFAGALAARMVWRHPALELVAVTSRGEAGTRLDEIYPRHRVPLELQEPDLAALGEFDAAIVGYPHAAAAPMVRELCERGVRVVDLSADFRIRDLDTYERWYGEHGAPELIADAAYGLTEIHRDSIRDAGLVANPGCYPTASLLGLAPAAQAGLVAGVVIDAKSGVSGAGRGGGEALHFSNVDENFKPYKVGGHRHLPEIKQELTALATGDVVAPDSDVTFVPHLLPIDQGLLASCYFEPAHEITEEEMRELYVARYANEPFVEVVTEPPGVSDVRETNFCRIHVALDAEHGRAMVFSAIDNLWKGAAGQALQNLNLMLCLDEGEGLL